MKINKVVFKNINSLKGEHVIDFEDDKLSNAGLILITGPTGSGKSTILDVITLALYNKIPRFGSISKNVISGQGSIITHHTKDAFAEVFYTVNNVTYVSKWSVAYNRNNNLNDYNMELWNLNTSTTITDKKGDIPEANEKIIGLSYDQFIKSILLSQGEFAQFLKANHEDRALLLEKITGTHVYREIGKLTFAKHKTARENLELETNALKHLQIKTQEEIDSILSEISNLKTDSQHYELKINELLTQKNKVDQYNGILKDIENIKNELIKNESLKSAIAQKKSTLALHEKLNIHKDGLSRYLKSKDQHASKSNELQKLVSKEKDIKEELSKLFIESESIIKINSEESTLLNDFTQFEIKFTSLEKELHRLKEEGNSVRNITNDIASRLNASIIPWFKTNLSPELALISINETLAEVNEFLNQNKINEKVSIAQFGEENNHLNAQLLLYNDVLQITKEQDALNKLIEENKIKIITENENIRKFSTEIETIHNQKKEKSDTLIMLQKEKDENFKKLELTEIRNTLIDNEPCPLCGSINHPYVEHNAIFSIGETEIKINEIDKHLKSLTLAENQKTTEMATSKANIKNWEKQNHLSDEKFFEINTRLKAYQNQGIGMENIEETIVGLNEKQKTNNHILIALEKRNLLAPLKEKYESLQHISVRFRAIQAEMKSLTDAEKPMEIINSLKLKFNANQNNRKENAIQLSEVRYTLESLQKEITEAENKLLPIIKSLGIHDAAAAVINILSEEAFTKIKTEIEKVENDGKTLESNLNLKSKELSNIENEINGLASIQIIENELVLLNNKQKENRERTGVLNQILSSNEENKNKISNQEIQLNHLRKELRKWELLKEAINADANGKNYSNFAQELTLQHIIILANKRLTRLSDRYLLRAISNDLFVIDLYQANIERSVKTLSGGESFIVSLALALSLSDLASQNIKLDCLFIDEGFGSLDSDMLDVVISTLERLQSESEKTIGIISHVDSLRDRIVTQIKLNKNHQGYSTIDIGFVN